MHASDQISGNPELLLPSTQDVPELKSLGPFGSFILSSKLLLSSVIHDVTPTASEQRWLQFMTILLDKLGMGLMVKVPVL